MTSVVARALGDRDHERAGAEARPGVGLEHRHRVQVHAVVAQADPAPHHHDRVADQGRRELLVGLAEEHDGDLAAEVLDLHDAVLVARVAGRAVLHARHEPGDRHRLAVPRRLPAEQLGDARRWRAGRAGASRPASGWSLTYRPSISRSAASFSRLGHSGRSGIASTACSGSSHRLSKSNPTCPFASARLSLTARSTAPSWISMSARRVDPSESNAPALISDSTVRLFAACSGHLAQEVVEAREGALLLARPA